MWPTASAPVNSFDAGFIHFFVNGKSKSQCLEFGAVTGAVSTTRAGGTGAFTDLDQVKSIAGEKFNYRF